MAPKPAKKGRASAEGTQKAPAAAKGKGKEKAVKKAPAAPAASKSRKRRSETTDEEGGTFLSSPSRARTPLISKARSSSILPPAP